MPLKILIVNYKLRDNWTYQNLLERANDTQLAHSFKNFPGLLFKTFINNREENIHGGIYLFESQNVLNNYLASDLFKSVKNNPHFTHVTTQSFDIFSKPTRVMMDFFKSDSFKSMLQQDDETLF